ncbi:MAG: bifunctional aldolase/short-chain dehydrogenase [Polyangiales bacterium]
MKSDWSDKDAARAIEHYGHLSSVNEDLALRVYTSRLIGRNPALVLHGGGNTSVKTTMADDLGATTDVLCVKGSGWDLESIEPAGLPAVRLDSLFALRQRESLSDEDMVNAQRTRLLDASAPNPSVETLLHAFIPHKFVDHSHADAILAIVDQPNAREICGDLFGDSLAVVDYIMPGFDLAKLAADVHDANPGAHGLLLLKHGLFTYGATAKESYERHIEAVDRAEQFANGKRVQVQVPRRLVSAVSAGDVAPILRGKLSELGQRVVLELRTSDAIDAFLRREDLDFVSQRGTATPDHVIRTKRVPMILNIGAGDDAAAIAERVNLEVDAYREAYREYVVRNEKAKSRIVKALDPNPCIVLVPGLGVFAAGTTKKAAKIAADLYEHTIDIVEMAEAVGRYEVLSEGDLFDMEYWSLEQAKLGKSTPNPLQGRVVYISGAASGIGAATARRFAAKGANLFLTDRNADGLASVCKELGAAGDVVDATDEEAVRRSIAECVAKFGGLDGVVSNAGAAPQGAIGEIATEALKKSFEINFFSHQYLAAAAVNVMKKQNVGGFLLFNASKAAFNPGADFGPYAIPKASVVALMKQYALEYGELGIRSNAVNADRIRTGMLDEKLVAERAAARGLDADAYFKSNLLKREVLADDVANAFVDLALSPSTTGCVLTVDGGNIAASPR